MPIGAHIAAFGHPCDRALDLRDECLHIGRGSVGLGLDLVHRRHERPAPRDIDQLVVGGLPGQQGHDRFEHSLDGLLSARGIQLTVGSQVVEQGYVVNRVVRLVHGADGAEQRTMVRFDEIILEQHRENVLANVLRTHAGCQDNRLLLRGNDGACRLGFSFFGFSRHDAHHFGNGMHANRLDSGACCHLPALQGAWGTPWSILSITER